MMYSPRSVSTASIPAASRAWLRPISSDALCAHRPAEVDDDLARFLGVLRVVDLAAALAHLALVGLEIEVEMGERVILDRAGAVSKGVELGKPGDRGRPSADEIA
jgi:hypothetical protein